MPRTIQIVLPADGSATLAQHLLDDESVVGLSVQQGASLKPPGDLITIQVLDRHLPRLMEGLVAQGVGVSDDTSIVTGQPLSVVSSSSNAALVSDTNESTLEEVEQIMARDAPPTANMLVVMGVAGVVATVGIAQNALHLVIAAMLIAPGFVPIVRAVFGGVARRGDVLRGLYNTVVLYAAMMLAAGITAVALMLLGHDPTGQQGSYLPPLVLVNYWTSITPLAILVSLAASVAGVLVIVTHRSVLTAGVMVALALVPAATLVPIGLVAGDLELLGLALLRLIVEVSLVAVASLAVLLAKQRLVHRRQSLL
jgi:hypothetical protein